MRPTNFGNPPRYIQIHQHQNEYNTEVEEIVPETQQSNSTPESNPTQRQEGKGKKKYKTRSKKQPWTRVEEETLMSAYIDVSEDSIVGNAQAGECFWKRVEHMFYNIMGRRNYRTHYQINAKCGDLKKKVTRFSGIYNKLVINKSSGLSDADILEKAYGRYAEEAGSAFGHEHCWRIVKHNPKWSMVPPMSTGSSRGSKRSKTSDSSDARFNRVDDDDYEDDIQEPERPIRRTKARRGSTSYTHGSNADDKFTRLLDTITKLKDKVDTSLDYKKKKLDLQLENQRKKYYNFFISSHEHLTGDALKVTKAFKEQIRVEYNW